VALDVSEGRPPDERAVAEDPQGFAVARHGCES
jgi:hypothetical protein